MEEKSQAWCSLLEDSSAWNDTNDGGQSINHFDRAPAASTFINSATSHRAALPQFSALASSCGQILSPIHQTSKAAVTLSYGTPSKISDYLTEYSITKTDDLVANITHKSCDSVPQSNLKCTNTLLQSNDKERLPILRSQNPFQIVKQHPEEHLQQTPKDVYPTRQTLEGLCKSKTKTNATRSLVFPFPSDHNLYLQSGKQSKFETGLAGSSPSSTTRPTDTLKYQSDVNTKPAARKSFPDLFNPSLPIRAEPAGRDIPESLNQPSPAPLLTDDQENKVPVLHKRHNNVSNPNSSDMNSVVIESTSKEQVRYKKISRRNVRHKEMSATLASSGMDAEISKVTGYATNLSTLLEYMTIDERVKLLPPSTLKSNVAPDPGGPFIKDAVGRSYASTDSSPIPVQKGLSHCDKDVPPFSIEKRSKPAWLPVNRNVTETEDSMMPPVGNRDNFIPVGSESNIQTIGKSGKFFRGVTVGGGGSGLSKKLDANIHITISKGTSSLEVGVDNPLPIEERERFLPTGADSESLDRASSSSSSCSNTSDDDINGSYQSNHLQNKIFSGSSTEPGSTPLHRELCAAELLDTALEGATASCVTDTGNILTKKSTEDYMDVVEREKYIKTDLFGSCEDLPKNAGQKSGFKDHFDYDQDKSNVGKSEPDLLLGHSLNFGISGPDLYPIIASDENVRREENGGLSDRKPGFVSNPSLAIPPSITIQDFENHTRPIMEPAQPLPFVDFTCPNEEDEDDTDELINMVSSVLLEPNSGISSNKSDPAAAAAVGKLHYRSIDVSDVSTPSSNPRLSQSNLNDNVSTATSNPQTESGRGTLGSSDVSNSPLNGEDNSKTQEDQKLSSQDISCKTKESSSTSNITNLKTENIAEVQTLNSSQESLGNVDKSSEVHNKSDASVKISHLHLPYSERTSRSTDLYLPLSIAVKGSMDSTMTSDLSSAHSYENDQSQDSDILGRKVNSLLCRTAYLEYRNQNAHISMAKNESSVIDQTPRSIIPLVPSTEAYELDAGSNSTKSSYTEKEGLNYDQLEQDLTELQNGLAQGLHLKSPILKDEEIFISIGESINKTDPSKNSPDVLQDSRMPTNLFRKTMQQQQADLLLGMDRLLRKKEDAFESAASVCLPLLSGELGNEIPRKKECYEGSATQNMAPRHSFTADVETASTVPHMVLENKPKRQSQTKHEQAFVNPNQMNNNDNATGGASLGSTQGFTRTPHVSDELALRVERILSEEPLYSMNNLNFLDRIRPKTGFFRKLSFSSDCKSTKAESISDKTETDSGPAESQTSKDSFDKCSSDSRKTQEINRQDPDFKITGGFENNGEEIYFGESVASKESSENFNCSTLSNSSHSMDSFKKEKSLGVPDSAVVQPSRKDLTNDDDASNYPTKTEAFDISRLAFVSSEPFSSNLNGGTQNLHLFTCKEDVPIESINFGHNETLPYPVDESSNSIKFLDEDVRRCLDWSNMSTFSSPPKETVPAAETVNLLAPPEMMENITDVDPESNFVSISNIPNNDPKQIQNGSISGKSTTNSSHSESECHSLNTVASVHAISAERKLSKSSQLESHLQEEENFQQKSDVTSTSSSSSSKDQNQKCSTDNISTRRIDLGSSSEDLRQLSKDLTRDDSLRLDNDMYISSKSNYSPQKSPYKLSHSESQPDFHPRNKISRKSANRSCSDINALLHSEESTSSLKPKGHSDIDSLRRDLDALSNYEQMGNDLVTPAILEREKPKESADVSSLPSSKSFPSVSPSMVVSPFEMEHDSVTAVSQSGDCRRIKGHSGDSTSVASQFYESLTSREFVIGKASSSTSSTNQSQTSSAWISCRKSTSKGKKYDPSVPGQADDKLETTVKVKYPLNQQGETVHVHLDQSNGVELNYRTSKIYQTQTQSERTETKSSNGTSSSPSGSEDSVASDKTWTLRPYKPASSREWYYTNYCDDLITGESGTTTLESADTGSDDAIGPPIPEEFLGSRVNVPSRPGIYSRSIHKKNIPIQEDLILSTIHEKSFVDEKDSSSWILEKKNPQYVCKANDYSAKSPTIEPGNLLTPGTKSVPRNKDFRETCQTSQRIEQFVSKENIGATPLDQKLSPRPADIENLTEVLYDDRRLLETDDVETCRESRKYPEKLAVNQSVIDFQTKNSSSFESGRTTIDSPSGFTDPDNVPTDFFRRSDPTLSSDESDQLQDIACTVGQCHPLVRYAPVNQWNSAEVQENPNPSTVGNTSCAKKPGILSQRGERVVRSSKELDLLWEKFKQQDHSSDHESSLDSARLGHMQQLLKNPTHALVHHSLAKKESIRLKQAKMAARKMEEQKRALLCSKIQDESSSISGSLYSNRNLSSHGIMRRDEGSISSRPSCTSDTLSSVAEERQVRPHQVEQPGSKLKESEPRLSDPIMAQLREKIDKQRKKCQQTKLRDKASEQKLQKLTHILLNRQMNDLVLAAEMRRLSTTSTASMTTASETLPESQWQSSCKNQPTVTQKETNPVSKQQSDKYHQKDRHPLRLDQNGRPSQNSTGQEMIRVQRHCSKPKEKITRNVPNHNIIANSPDVLISEQDDASNCSDFQRRRPRMKDATTMVPSPKVVTDETSDDGDSCQLIKASIGIQTSPPRKMLNQSNVHVAKQAHANRTTTSSSVKNLGTMASPHKSASVEEVQVIPVPFLSTPKRYKNMTNEAIDKASHNNVEKTSVNKGSDSWFVSLFDQPTNSTNSSRQRQQHTQLMRPFTGSPKAKGRQNKLPPRKPQGLTKRSAGSSRALVNHAVVPAYNSSPESSKKMLAITNEKFNGIDNQITLQDAFNNYMQHWISRSRERQKRIALAADERRYQEQMELEREEIFLNKKAPANNIIPHPFSDNLHQPKKRDLSKKEIKELNQRFYKKLPEVVQHKVLLNRASEYRTNRIRSRMFSMRVQKSLLTKTTCR